MERTNVYIDGFNLFYGALKGSPYKWLNLEALCQRLLTVLITNDSDLREPLRLVRDELRLRTGVINPHEARRRSRALQATFFKQLRPSALAGSQLRRQLTDLAGRKITKPSGW